MLTPEQVNDYHRDGYVIARQFFDAAEISLLKQAAMEDKKLDDQSYGQEDGEGGVARLSLWNHPGNGIYGMFARCERTVNSMEQILGGEVYHYHSNCLLYTSPSPRDPE